MPGPARAAQARQRHFWRQVQPTQIRDTAGNREFAQLLREGIGQSEISEALRSIQAWPGKPIETGHREKLEAQFGEDFRDVRLHTDSRAADAAQQMRARAFTMGTNIVFAARRHEPETERGRNLLAHELTHVVQQRRGRAAGDAESDARNVGKQAAQGEAVSVAASAPLGVQRQPDDEEEKKGQGSAKKPAEKQSAQAKEAERKQSVLKEFAERQRAGHAQQPAEQLKEPRTRIRTKGSEVSRHVRAGNLSLPEGHHAFPQYLGGEFNQKLIKLPNDLHYLYHQELDKIVKLPRNAATKQYWQSLTPAEREAKIAELIKHAEGFDARYRSKYTDKRTSLAAAMRRGIKEARKAKFGGTVTAPKAPATAKPAAKAKTPKQAPPKPAAAGQPKPKAAAPKAAAKKQAATPGGVSKPAAKVAPPVKPSAPVAKQPAAKAPLPSQRPAAVQPGASKPAADVAPPVKPSVPVAQQPPAKAPVPSQRPATPTQGKVTITIPSGRPPPTSGPSDRGQAVGGGIVLGLQAAHGVLSYFADKYQQERAQKAYEEAWPAIQKLQEETGKGVTVIFHYTSPKGRPDVRTFTFVEWKVGYAAGPSPVLHSADTSATADKAYIPPIKEAAERTDEGAAEYRIERLWERQKVYQRAAEKMSTEGRIGRFLLEREGSHLETAPVYDARAHLKSAAIAIRQKRFGAAQESMDRAEEHLDVMHRNFKAYMGD